MSLLPPVARKRRREGLRGHSGHLPHRSERTKVGSVLATAFVAVGSLSALLLATGGGSSALPSRGFVGRAGSDARGTARPLASRALSRRGRTAASALATEVVAGAERSTAGLWGKLFDWVNSTGTDTSDFAVEVAPSDVAKGELGLVAKRDLEAGDILIWAPTSMLLSRGRAVERWPFAADLEDRVAIMMLLIYERCVLGESSEWATYWGGLPSFAGDVSGPSFLWEEDEWEWLAGSDGYPASIQMQNRVVDMWESVQPLMKERPEEFPPEAFTAENFFWAAGVVSSRAYGDDAEGSHLCIAPLVDFLNHKAGALQLTRFGNGIVAYAHKRYQKGDEVWVSYGGKNNAQILSQYGFVDEDNQEEAVFLRVGEHLKIAEPHAAAKAALLAELLGDGRPAEAGIFRLARRPREWQAQLIPAVRILALGAEDTPPATVRELVPTQAFKLEGAAWRLLAEAMESRDGEYPGTLQENRRQLDAGGLTERQALGLRLRLSERELLLLSRAHCLEQAELVAEAQARLEGA
mmetsp:Transcript_108013/g.290467  ORF Transcript_108013/g.290467 Transcript_108013/m.290467 type:complete len:523 (+) Transcript_108013:59-1627(+)